MGRVFTRCQVMEGCRLWSRPLARRSHRFGRLRAERRHRAEAARAFYTSLLRKGTSALGPGVERTLQVGALSVGLAFNVVGSGYILNLDWAGRTWPWPDTRLSHLFVGSIMVAVAVAFIWIGVVREWGAVGAGATTVMVMCGGWSIYLVSLLGARASVTPFAIFFGTVAAASAVALVWSSGQAIVDRRQMPTLMRLSFAAFAVVLMLAGGALVLRDQIFPWVLNPDSAVMFGCIFLGDACYFAYSLTRPLWHNARGQLLSFLAYDLVLIPPFVGLFATVTPGHRLSLLLYLSVLFYSGGLAVYYLFLDGRTRGWAVQRGAGA